MCLTQVCKINKHRFEIHENQFEINLFDEKQLEIIYYLTGFTKFLYLFFFHENGDMSWLTSLPAWGGYVY